MPDATILAAALVNGATQGAIYALIALGLTLIYGVLHIINFAHGAALMAALYAVLLLFTGLGVDPYVALPIVTAGMFALGYALQRMVIGPASHGRDENILLVTLGVAILLENLALVAFKSDTRTIDTPYAFATVDVGGVLIAVPKLAALGGALAMTAALFWLIERTDLGRAIRAVAKERQGARLCGIDVEHVFALCYGIGLACVGAAACFLLPSYYVNPTVGGGFVLIAFTVVVLGGMGSFVGALVGGFVVGLAESLGGLAGITLGWGENMGQLGIFLVFIAVLLFRPQGLFGARG
ncbi:MAG: branched-chain amino acid ABC transporter permease [Betaproteobacteria bacterium]|nr:branched-chain amino acid ABC transporter permease [Betaproteobacteria bacterium]MDH5287367.1 branched-chain amino acid ABC transporter permease [Betaproteobacteria bacterium]